MTGEEEEEDEFVICSNVEWTADAVGADRRYGAHQLHICQRWHRQSRKTLLDDDTIEQPEPRGLPPCVCLWLADLYERLRIHILVV